VALDRESVKPPLTPHWVVAPLTKKLAGWFARLVMIPAVILLVGEVAVRCWQGELWSVNSPRRRYLMDLRRRRFELAGADRRLGRIPTQAPRLQDQADIPVVDTNGF